MGSGSEACPKDSEAQSQPGDRNLRASLGRSEETSVVLPPVVAQHWPMATCVTPMMCLARWPRKGCLTRRWRDAVRRRRAGPDLRGHKAGKHPSGGTIGSSCASDFWSCGQAQRHPQQAAAVSATGSGPILP